MTIEAMKQWLEAFKWASEQTNPQENDHCACPICTSIDDLRQAIAEAEKQEPVAWCVLEPWLSGKFEAQDCFSDVALDANVGWVPLYTHPQPKREWVGLTQAERHDIREWQKIQEELGPVWSPMMLYLYEAIEAKLKEKNT